jgi:hypothetical protein
MRRSIFCTLAIIFLGHQGFAQSTAAYTVTFNATWSSATHPTEFPGNAHFSGLIGGTHDSSVSFWRGGDLASRGIQNMAELGSKVPLSNEVDSAIRAGSAEYLLSGGGISHSPGSVSLSFQISATHPLVTLVSMVAPSPDWFAGVSGLSLYSGGSWVDSLEVALYPWDAGTDDGVTYASPDLPAIPHHPVAPIQSPPFLVNGSVPSLGTFKFVRTSGLTSVRDTERPRQFNLFQNYPNPFNPTTVIRYDVPGVRDQGLGIIGQSLMVSLKVFDVLGREVATLVNDVLPAGSYEKTFDGSGLASGVYFYRLQARPPEGAGRGDFMATRRFVLLK